MSEQSPKIVPEDEIKDINDNVRDEPSLVISTTSNDIKTSNQNPPKVTETQLLRMVDPSHESLLVTKHMPPPVGLPNYLTNSKLGNTKKKRVLDEDTYIAGMESIIERDFFPSLHYVKKYEEMYNDDDSTSIRSSSDSHVTIEQLNVETIGDKVKRTKLNDYFRKYTSEDNQSFSQLLQKDERNRQLQYHWAYDINPGNDETLSLEDAKKKKENMMLYITDEKVLTLKERQEFDDIMNNSGIKVVGDDRPVAPETWPVQVRNPLMFPPEPLSNKYDPYITTHKSERLLLTDGSARKSNVDKKEVVYSNTNFQDNSIQKLIEDQLNTRRERLQRLQRTPSYSDSSWETDSIFHQSDDGLFHDRKEYSFVPMTPVITPGVDMSPIITWGELASKPIPLTPIIPSAAETIEVKLEGDSKFIISDLSNREKLARKLQTKASKSAKSPYIKSTQGSALRSIPATPLSSISKMSKSSMGTISSMSRQRKLTPAGQALAQRLSQSSLGKKLEPFGGSLQSVYHSND